MRSVLSQIVMASTAFARDASFPQAVMATVPIPILTARLARTLLITSRPTPPAARASSWFSQHGGDDAERRHYGAEPDKDVAKAGVEGADPRPVDLVHVPEHLE